MNGWIIFGFVLALLAIIASIALWLRDKISQLTAQRDAFKKTADAAAEENARLCQQLETLGKGALERDKRLTIALQERDALRLQLEEATRPRPIRTQTDGNAAPRKPRQVKPPMNE